MKRTMIKFMAAILTFIMMLSIAGCATEEGDATTAGGTETTDSGTERVEIEETDGDKEYPKVSWYIRPSAQEDMELVVEELNKIFREKVGAELEIKRIDPGDYGQKMMTIIAAGEEFDMMHSAPRYGYYENVARGAYLPLDNLLQEYAPKTYENMRSEFWDAARVDGKIYGIVNRQIFGRQSGLWVRKDIYDTLDLASRNVKTLQDINDILPEVAELAKDGEETIYINRVGLFGDALTYFGLDPLDNDIGTIAIGDDNPVAVNRYATEAYAEYAKMMEQWYEAGYINKAAPTRESNRDFTTTGKILTVWNNYKPGCEFEVNTIFGAEMVYLPIEEPFVNTQNVIATMTSISQTSKNPEKAMQILELVNTDPAVYNLLVNGIEGKHYNKVAENKIEPVADSGYAPNCGWMVGNQFNAYLMPGQEDGVWEKTIEVNNTATVSSLMGLSIDLSTVKNEYVQCKSVLDEYLPVLNTGAVDAEQYLAEMLNKLEEAGIQKILDEENKQIQAFLAK